MKTKIILSLIIVAVYGLVINFINQSVETWQKYAAMNQFDNSELSLKLMQNLTLLGYTNYALFALLIFQLYKICKK